MRAQLAIALMSLLASAAAQSAGDRWTGFRGHAFGHTQARELPLAWSRSEGEAAENLAWSIALPGYGQSSPVVWKGRVFVTSVDGANKERAQVTCYRLRDGALLWSRSFAASIEIQSSRMVSRAAPTPVVDASGVYAFFESGDLFALDLEGELRWKRALCKEYGKFQGNHGIGSSVLGHADSLVLLLDHDGPSYLLRVRKSDGKNVWKLDRAPRVSWSTPIVRETELGAELVLSSNGEVCGVGFEDGEKRWAIDGIEGNTVPSPTLAPGAGVVVGASKGDGNVLIRSERGARVAWRAEDSRPLGFASPLVAHGAVYFLGKSGALACTSLATGKLLWRKRIAETCWASPITDGRHLWFFGKSGQTTVLALDPSKPEAEPREVARNEIETEDSVYGVAVVDGCFVVREGKALHCVRKEPPAPKKTAPAGAAPKARVRRRRG